MTQDLLDVDARLLVVRYGRARVLQALARLGDQTVEDLERQIEAIGRKAKPKRAQPVLMDLVAVQAGERHEIGEPLRVLAIRFENRTFLPQLRDVERFLDRVGASHGKLKSRTAAAPTVIRALAKLGPDELARLAAEQPDGDSDYSLLARAIMGAPPAKPSDPSENR